MLMGLGGLILGGGDYNDKPNGRNPDTTQVKDSRSCCLSNVPGALHQLCKSFKPDRVSLKIPSLCSFPSTYLSARPSPASASLQVDSEQRSINLDLCYQEEETG